MKTFILIYAISTGAFQGGISANHIEFNSLASCVAAAEKLIKVHKNRSRSELAANPICIEK